MHPSLSAMLSLDGSCVPCVALPQTKSKHLYAMGEIHPQAESHYKPIHPGKGEIWVEFSTEETGNLG